MTNDLATRMILTAGFALTWLVQSTVLLALGLLAGKLVRRSGPAVQSAVYRTTLVAVLACPAASALLARAGLDGLDLRLPLPGAGGLAEPDPGLAFTAQPGVLPSISADPAVPEIPDRAEPASPISGAVPTPVAAGEAMGYIVNDGPRPGRPWPLLVAIAVLTAWPIGSFVLAVRLAVGQRRMSRLRAAAVPVEPDVEAICREIASRLRLDSPEVLRSPFLFSPCLDGLRRPAILLPDDVADNLRDTFVHELAHLARRDVLWNLLRRLTVVVLWGQPLLWILSRRLEATAEEVCDDYVVQFGADRARYAGHLVELAGRALPPTAISGVGMISLRSLLARRVVRILDPSRSLSIRAGRRAVAASLFAGLAGTLLAGLLGVGGARQEARAQVPPPKAAEARPEEEKIPGDSRMVRGQVVDEEGKPIPGVSVIASRRHVTPDGIDQPRRRDLIRHGYHQMVTDRDGRFAFEAPLEWPEDGGPAVPAEIQVTAMAPGYGLGYYLKDRPIRLRRGGTPINGRVVDLQGRPVAGANIRLIQLQVPDRSMDGGGIGIDGEPVLPGGVTTDADGRFRIEGLGKGVVAYLGLSGPTITAKTFWVHPGELKDRAARSLPPDYSDLRDRQIYGADCTVVVAPTRPIEGIVKDLETGEPIPGAIVTGYQLSGSRVNIEGEVRATTDARGHYRLVGLPKEGGEGHRLKVFPPLDRPYFITDSLRVPSNPGLEANRFDIPLRRGIWIEGKVTDLKTGKPVRAGVGYHPLLSNPHARDYRNFDPNVSRTLPVDSRYRTDREGRYRVVGLPGRGVVTVRGDDKGYRAGVGAEAIERTEDGLLSTYDHIFPPFYQGLKEVSPPAGVKAFGCDLTLDPGGSVTVKLVDEGGKPVSGATFEGRFPDSLEMNGDHNLHDETAARVGGIDPGETRTAVFRHKARRIGAVLDITPEMARAGGEVTLALRPNATVTGRFVGEIGSPAPGGIQVRIVKARPGRPEPREIRIADAQIGDDGRFRSDEIPPGARYLIRGTGRLVFGLPYAMDRPFKDFELARDLAVESGQTVDLGTFDVKTGRRVDAPKAEAAARPTPDIRSADVPITGRVIDLEGRPIPGVAVKIESITRSRGDDLGAWLAGVRQGEPPWVAYKHLINEEIKVDKDRVAATTDADGKFRLGGLGGERVVELKLQGDSIAFARIKIATRKTEPVPGKGFANQYGPGTQTIYGADFTYIAQPTRPIEGIVRDAGTKQPMVGVTIQSCQFSGSNYAEISDLATVSDARGHFRLAGMPKGKENRIMAVPNDDQPYFQREIRVGDSPGAGPATVDVELHRGIWITGRVTDKATGKPVHRARLHYLPFLDNPFIRDLPEFDRGGGSADGSQMRYLTDAEGRYKLVGMPGRAIVGAEGVERGMSYLAGIGSESIRGMGPNDHFETHRNPIQPSRSWPNIMAEIDPAEGTDAVTLDFQLDPGVSLSIRVVDPDGKPVPDATVTGGNQLLARPGTPDGEFELLSFRPGETRTVIVRHVGRRLGKVIRLAGGADRDGPVVVALEPTATIRGRTLDHEDSSVSAARVRVDVTPDDGFILNLLEVVSDSDGRFEAVEVPAGCDYSLNIEAGMTIKDRRYAHAEAKVKPGETTDVGDIRFK